MGHNIKALVLKGEYDKTKVMEYDLVPIALNKEEITLFHITDEYVEYWQHIIINGVSLNSLDTSYPVWFPYSKVLNHIIKQVSSKDCLFAIIQTEYFGGMGEQYACVYKGDDIVPMKGTTINEALQLLGILKLQDLDEFDTLGLSNYRRTPEYLDKYHDLVEELGL